MRIGPFELSLRTKAAVPMTAWPSASTSIRSWWPYIRESFAGAWQRGIVTPVEDALSHPTFWACVTLIASDVAKCRACLVEEDANGIVTEVERQSPYRAVLERPNHYQNRIQFFTSWILSKLMHGNVYALKERDARGIVTALYLLDPRRVRPAVSPQGEVFYACQQDVLAGLTEDSLMVPAREIIHDIAYAPYHPLCGFSPIYAAGHVLIQGLTIVGNATKWFRNGLQLGGVLTAPDLIPPDVVKRIETYWQENYLGPDNAGKVAVLGSGLKFDQPKMMTAVDSQLIDQLKWGDEKICAVLHVPPYKVAVGPLPSYNNVEALGQEYYGDCLQIHIESVELCLTEGLELESVKRPDGGTGYEVEFDIDALERMDSVQRMEVATKGVIGAVYKPDEARRKFNLGKVPGGDRVYLQQQNWPLELLGADAAAKLLTPVSQPALPAAKAAELDTAALLDLVTRGLAA